jgi:hypothetical protein
VTVEYMTVVYRLDGDEAQRSAWWRELLPLFLADGLPVSIVAVGRGDQMTKEPEAADDHG